MSNNTARDSHQLIVSKIESTRDSVDEYIDQYFTAQMPMARAISLRYEKLWKAGHTLAMAGGKRLRPYMVLLAYRTFADDNTEQVMPAAIASELKHIAMLIHDDIIDRDDTRYAIANVAGQYLSEYNDLNPSDQRHFANSAAMLMGDALLSEGHRLLLTASDDLSRLRKAQSAFSTAILHVIGGELIDTESSIRPIDDVHAITVARYKTASYSFIGPLSIGAHLAGASDTEITALQQYADSLGIAFQLQDDLLGTFGNSDVTGKSNNTDLIEGKRTYLVEQFDRSASREASQKFYSLFKNQNLSGEQADQLRALLIDSGAVEKTEAAITNYALQAKSSLDALKLDSRHHQEFLELISVCTERAK